MTRIALKKNSMEAETMRKTTITILMAISIVVILMSGCLESRQSYKKVNVTDEIRRSTDSDLIMYPYMWNYYPYYYGYSPIDYVGTSSSSVRTFVYYPTEDMYVRSPEIVEAIERPNGAIDYEQIGFLEPGAQAGEFQAATLEGEPMELDQLVLEAQTSEVTNVGEIPDDHLTNDGPLDNPEPENPEIDNIDTTSDLGDGGGVSTD